MSTNSISANVADAADFFASIGPHTSIQDFAAIFEATGKCSAGKNSGLNGGQDSGCTKAVSIAKPVTAQKATSEGNPLDEHPEETVESTAGDPISLVVCAPPSIPINEEQTAEGQLSATPGSVSRTLEPTDEGKHGNSLEMRVGGRAGCEIDSSSKGNKEIYTGSTAAQLSIDVSKDSEKTEKTLVPTGSDIPPIATGADSSCSMLQSPSPSFESFEREIKARPRDNDRKFHAGLLPDGDAVVEKSASTVAATRSRTSVRNPISSIGIHESSKRSSETITSMKGGGTNRLDLSDQSVVAENAPPTQSTDIKLELLKFPLGPFAKNTPTDDTGSERSVQSGRHGSRSEVLAPVIGPGIEPQSRGSEVQRSALKLDGKAEMSVHLRTQGLGSVEVRTVVQGRKVEASILTSEGYAVNASPEAIVDLRDRLATHALTLETLSFQDKAMESGASHDGRRQNETPEERLVDSTSSTEDLIENSGTTSLQGHLGVLNVRV